MRCDQCGNEATVHEVTIRAGKSLERHLCEACAKQAGYTAQAPAPLAPLFLQSATPPPQSPPGTVPAVLCESCGTTYAQFRQSGTLGCARCYLAFEKQLGSLLARAHEGGTHHVGKVPRRLAPRFDERGAGASQGVMASAEERRQRCDALRRQLEEALASEQYERAAAIRDELRTLAGPGPAHPARERGELP